MKKIPKLIISLFVLFVFVSCQQDSEMVQKYNPIPVFTVGDYDNTNVEGVLGFMDPIFYNSIYVQDSDYHPVVLAGSYADRLPDENGRTGGKCIPSQKLCIILCMIPNNFQDFSTMSTTYGYDINEPTYRDIMVICKEDEPIMQQGLYYTISYNTDNEVVNFEMTGINAEEIIYNNGDLEIIPE